MQEILPGVLHWAVRHPNTGQPAHSHLLVAEGVVLDPMVPEGGLDVLPESGAPRHVLLSNRHHLRDASAFAAAFGCRVHASRPGLPDLGGAGVEPFDFGDLLPGGVVAHEVGTICPDETAFFIPAHRALAVADGVIGGRDGGLAFVPDFLMDRPEQTKAGLRAAYARLTDELEWDHLLLAHGDPVRDDGRTALRAFSAP